MRSLVTVLTLALLFAFSLSAEQISYTDSWGTQGLTLERQGVAGLQMNFSVEKFFLQDRMIEGESMKTLQMPGVLLPYETGAPDLPGASRFIAIPQGATASIRIISSRIETMENVNIAPAPRIPLDTEDGPMEYTKNSAIYSNDTFYPANPVQLSEITQIRGVDVAMLGITPFQYNPVTKELKIYRDLKVEVEYIGGNGHFGDDAYRSRWFDPILKDAIFNSEVLKDVEYQTKSNAEGQDYEYVIIVPDNPDYLAWADSIKEFRTMQGIRTGVVTLSEIGGNNSNTIKSWITNAYQNWTVKPVAILFMADYGTGPVTGNGIDSPTYNSYCVSDQIYSDMNNNHMADIVTARITAQTAAHLQIMVQKGLKYEKNPPTSTAYYNNPITAMGWQTERWFQICSESVNGFWEYSLGKQPVRENAIYSGSPTGSWSSNQNTNIVMDVFGPNGLNYLPATPNHLTDWGGNATRVINDINSGAFMMQHRDHGSTTGWGEPDFQASHISQLNNTDIPTYVFSINCLTGKFNLGGECFAEKFHRHPNGGALGIIAASETSYSFVNDTYVWGMYDNMWPNFMPQYGTTPPSRDILPAFGNAAGKYFLEQSSWPYNTSNKEVTYYLFHHHGDAFMNVYSEMPQNMNIAHTAVLFGGQSTFTVTADAGSFIALTVNGEIIGTAEGTGMPVDVVIPPQIPGNEMIVTVTKQNYYRYEQMVMITAASGPYLYVMCPTISDVNLNNNGVPECGETVDMNVDITNLGVEMAQNITATISTSDAYFTLIDSVASFGNILADDTTNVGTFTFAIDPLTPHLHHGLIDIHMEADSAGVAGYYQWDQTMHLTIREGAKIGLEAAAILYPNTFLTFTHEKDMTISNSGQDTLVVTDITSDIPQFAATPTTLVLAPGASQAVTVGFTPDTTQAYTGVITIINTDPVNFFQTFTVNGTGIFAPNVVAPDSIVKPMLATDSSTIQVNVSNNGPGELSFNAQIAGYDPNNAMLEGAGGSDTYGHMWIDSDESNGPTFDWMDITTTGTEIALTGNNSVSNKINIGFPFEFYGNEYNELRVCTNGWISFTTFSVAYNNFALPSNLAPRTMIAPIWDDLNFTVDSKVYFENQGNKAIILFKDVYRVTGEGPMTFEVVLYDNGNVIMQYLTLNNMLNDYTVGIQNHVADDGLTIAHNEAYLHDNLAILISRATWVSVSPMSGVLQPGENMDLDLTFVTNQFPIGDFWASLQIESNDPDDGMVIIPIHMKVGLTGIEDGDAFAMKGFHLYQNSPNPFNPTTTIAYSLKKAGDVELNIYNMLGQKVRTLVKGNQMAQLHKVVWDGNNDHGAKVASGIYVYRLKTSDNVAIKKMILMK